MNNEIIGIIAMVLAVIGVWCNNRKMIFCFYLWIISNSLAAIIHVSTDLWSLLLKDLIFLAFAFEGIYKWRKR